MPGFPLGYSTVVLFYNLSDFYSIPSLLPPRIDRASIPYNSSIKF
jgi:hypothetical protein